MKSIAGTIAGTITGTIAGTYGAGTYALTPTSTPHHHLFTVTGIIAAHIGAAIHSTFYGINGETKASHTARAEICKLLSKVLDEAGIECDSFQIMTAKIIDTSGTHTPYKAEIIIRID